MATAVKKPPATTTSSIPISSSSSSTRNDLKACLEILKRLAPRVTPDLPSLHRHHDENTSISHLNTSSITTTSPSNNNVTSSTIAATSSKRKSQAGRDGDGEEGEDEEQDTRTSTTIKRRKKSTSTLEEATSSPSITNNAKLGDHTSSVDPNATITTRTTNTATPKLPNFKTLASSSSNKHKRSGSTSSVASQSQQQPPSSSSSSRMSSGKDVENKKDKSSKKSASSAVIPAPLNLSGKTSNATSDLAANSAHSPPPLPSPAISVTTSNNNQSKSNHTRNASTVSVSNNNAYIAPSPLSPDLTSPPSGIWTKDRFKRIAAICREKGRALKHAGDKRMREYSSSSISNSANNNSKSAGGVASRHAIPVLALLEQLDAVILYAYAFWCEDQAAGYARTRQTSSASNASSSATSTSSSTSTLTSLDLRSNASNETRGNINNNNLNASTSSNMSASSLNGNGNGQNANTTTWKPGCIAENWKSIFGLVAFVRGRAEKMSLNPPSARCSPRLAEGLPRAMELVVAWLNMLEALILQHLTTNSSRHLNSQANRLLGAINSSSSTMGLSPPGGDNESTISSDVSSTGCASTISSSPETSNFLQSFLKLQSDLEKIHSLWPTSQNILLHPEQSSVRDHHNHKTSADSPNSPSSSTADDILSIVIRKGKMAYDLEPTKLDDFVIPNLPRDGFDVKGTFGFDDFGHNRSDASMTTATGGNGPKSPEDLFKDEENYFRFSWPVVLHHRNAVAHTTSFGRALLYEISERLHIDYKSPDIEPLRD